MIVNYLKYIEKICKNLFILSLRAPKGRGNLTQTGDSGDCFVVRRGGLLAMTRQLTPLLVCLLLLSACAGPDYMPEYFPSDEETSGAKPSDNKPSDDVSAPAGGSCTVQLKSTLCVAISGDNVKVGTGDAEALCTDVPPIPIEVNSGTGLILRGNLFPDIPFEGHGLPAPITIDGKGSGDGTQNVGTGKIDAGGNISIEGFSLFIKALGMVGELPDLTLTTEKLEDLDGLPELSGSPLASDGNVKIVIGTVLGHIFPAADEKLFGASMQATLEGTITPPLSECKGSSSKPQGTLVTKLVVSANGEETDVLLPGATQMETGTAYVAENPQDIGPKFETFAKFKIVNATSKPISIDIPHLIGAFNIESSQSLKQQLPPKTPLIIKVTFRPNIANAPKGGEIKEMMTIGPDIYQLIGKAVLPSGKVSVDHTDENGKVRSSVDNLNVGDVTVTTTGRREFFQCKKIMCNGNETPSQCIPCVDVLVNVCQLLSVDDFGDPVGEVDQNCKLVNKGGKDLTVIGLGEKKMAPGKQVIEIKNRGVKPVTINSIEVRDIQNSRSQGQFRSNVQAAMPVTLGSYELTGDVLKVTIVYEPNDLTGFDGATAVVGHPVKDRAVILVTTSDGNSTIEISGTTTVKEVPNLQVYFKSSTGTKEQTDASEFAFRGITNDTIDLAVPVFIKLSDSAAGSVRITKITVNDTKNFEWLDTKERINEKAENGRCSIPVFDANGNMTSRVTDMDPVSLLPNGFDLKPGAYTTGSMPLFGCVNFHMNTDKKRQNKATLTISTVELSREGEPVRNSDGSLKQASFNVNVLAVINPIKGKMVFRLPQTMSGIMNPDFAGIFAESSMDELKYDIMDGRAKEGDRTVAMVATVLDPFDEETIKDEQGHVFSVPGDGVTAIYRKVDTHPVPGTFSDPLLAPYTSFAHDGSAPDGERGIFFDFPNVPKDYKMSGLRLFTASLSYPGPLVTPEQRPENIFMCEQIDPCSEEGQKKLGQGTKMPGKRGVCAFFYGTSGAWQSQTFHEMKDMCKEGDVPQAMQDIGGRYDLNGNISFPDGGLRLWGPTFINNPVGPLGPVSPLNAVFHITFTTEVLRPTDGPVDMLPDKRVNVAKSEYKINLNDTKLETPRICDASVKNRLIHGERYSSWKYAAPLLVKDEEGTIPAGCPDEGNSFTGGSAFLRGRPLDQETGIVTFVGSAKFADDDNLTFALKDVMFFIIMNGWLCDPSGSEEQFEGSRCFDRGLNERDALSMISIMK